MANQIFYELGLILKIFCNLEDKSRIYRPILCLFSELASSSAS